MKDSNTNKSKQLEELYIKLDKVDKRMFRLVVRLHIQFLSEMVLCILCISWIHLVWYMICDYSVWIFLLLVLGGIAIMYKMGAPQIKRLCNGIYWRILKLKVVKSNYYLFLLLDISSKIYLAWYYLDYYFS